MFSIAFVTDKKALKIKNKIVISTFDLIPGHVISAFSVALFLHMQQGLFYTMHFLVVESVLIHFVFWEMCICTQLVWIAGKEMLVSWFVVIVSPKCNGIKKGIVSMDDFKYFYVWKKVQVRTLKSSFHIWRKLKRKGRRGKSRGMDDPVAFARESWFSVLLCLLHALQLATYSTVLWTVLP